MSIHVVQFSTVHKPDDSRVFHKVCKSLAQAGYQVTYVVPAERDYSTDGVTIKALPKPRNRMERAFLGSKALKYCLGLKADIYHFHDPELLPMAAILRAKTARPVIYDVHEYFAEGLLTKAWLPAPLRKSAAFLFPVVERLFVKRMSGVISVNDDLADSYRQWNPHSISVYNYPTFPETSVSLRTVGQPDSPKVLLCLGSISYDRGLEILLDMIQLVAEEHPTAVLRIVGKIDLQGAPVKCLEKLEKLRGAAIFQHVDQVDFNLVPGFLETATIGLVPLLPSSENQEGLPRKLFEYMLFGLPVVTSDLRRISAVVRKANCGLLAQDAVSFARAVCYLLSNEGERRRMGESGRVACLSSYSWNSQAAKLIDFYRQCLSA